MAAHIGADPRSTAASAAARSRPSIGAWAKVQLANDPARRGRQCRGAYLQDSVAELTLSLHRAQPERIQSGPVIAVFKLRG